MHSDERALRRRPHFPPSLPPLKPQRCPPAPVHRIRSLERRAGPRPLLGSESGAVDYELREAHTAHGGLRVAALIVRPSQGGMRTP